MLPIIVNQHLLFIYLLFLTMPKTDPPAANTLSLETMSNYNQNTKVIAYQSKPSKIPFVKVFQFFKNWSFVLKHGPFLPVTLALVRILGTAFYIILVSFHSYVFS